jgi:hypothetical protein
MCIFRQGRTNPKRRFALAIKFIFVAPMPGDSQCRTCFLPLFWRQEFEAALTFFLENLGNPPLKYTGIFFFLVPVPCIIEYIKTDQQMRKVVCFFSFHNGSYMFRQDNAILRERLGSC